MRYPFLGARTDLNCSHALGIAHHRYPSKYIIAIQRSNGRVNGTSPSLFFFFFFASDNWYSSWAFSATAQRGSCFAMRDGPEHNNGRNRNLPHAKSRRLCVARKGAPRRRNRILRTGKSQKRIHIYIFLGPWFCDPLFYATLRPDSFSFPVPFLFLFFFSSFF
jgi:hypothetical protein